LNTTLVSATIISNNTTTTTSVGGGQENASSTTTAITTTTNNPSNALLGRLFSYDQMEDAESNVNPVNETYIVISYSGNRIILPPNATGVINATETGNVTINIQPNGLFFNQGHAVSSLSKPELTLQYDLPKCNLSYY
jgi:tRNA splicing ligase